MREIFQIVSRKWRGVGEIPRSGLGLKDDYKAFDSEIKFSLSGIAAEESPECIAGLILQGQKKPYDCSVFGNKCTPEFPLGAPMVSSEGACAAYYQYRRL